MDVQQTRLIDGESPTEHQGKRVIRTAEDMIEWNKERKRALGDPEAMRKLKEKYVFRVPEKTQDTVREHVQDKIPSINRIYQILDKPVLIAIDSGEKRPTGKGWQKLTYAETQTPEYQTILRGHANTGVLLGEPSGDLIAIDFDDKQPLIEFISLNRDYLTLVTHGDRGGQVWYYIDGPYLAKVKKLELRDKDGNIHRIGEWRGGGGGQSIIRGIHPTGKNYKFLHETPPRRIRLEWLKFPEGMELPWDKATRNKANRAARENSGLRNGVADNGNGSSRGTSIPRRASKRTVLDGTNLIPLQLPGNGRLISDFCTALGNKLAPHDFYSRGGQVMVPRYDEASGNCSLIKIAPPEFLTAIEAIVVPFAVDQNGNNQPQSLGVKLAPSVLASPDLIEQLNPVAAVNSVRLPVLRTDGEIEILPEGYDPESKVLTVTNGKDWQDEPIQYDIEAAAQYWRGLLSEFCFHEEDRERSVAVVVSGALTLFCRQLFPAEVMRPAFLFSGNAEGCGKTLLAKIIQVATLGLTPVRTAPSTNDEMEKLLLAKILGGGSALFLDNLKGMLSSPVLEAVLTSSHFEGRILGASKEAKMQHGLTVFITGNGLQISPDLRRRVLHVDLFLRELKAEERRIQRNLDDGTLLAEKPRMLHSLLTLVQAWCDAGKPEPKIVHQSFLPWSKVVGGIVENGGFQSPFTANKFGEAGDPETRDMAKLIGLLDPNDKDQYSYFRIVGICKDHGLFPYLIPEEGDMGPEQNSTFGKILRRYCGRVIGVKSLKLIGETKRTRKFVVIDHEALNSTT